MPKRFGTLFFAGLAALVLAMGALTWRQRREIARLRAQSGENSLFVRRQAELRQSERALTAQLVERKAAAVAAGDHKSETEGKTALSKYRIAFRNAMEVPEFRSLLAAEQKAGLDQIYGSLFKTLQLSPEKTDQLKNLIVEAQLEKSDTRNVALEQGVPRTPELNQTVAVDQKDTDDQIRALIGDDGFAQLQVYNQERFLRLSIGAVEQTLSYTSTPMSDQQAEQVIAAIFPTTPQVQRESTGFAAQLGVDMTDVYLSNNPISAAGLAAAQPLLSPQQFQALGQLQQAQQSQLKLQQLRTAAHQPAPP